MVTISSLPSELISVIISATYSSIRIIPDWKASLVLLKVCQEWRIIGIPIIYGTAILSAYSNFGSDYADDEQAEPDALGVITNMRVITNLDYIKQSGHLRTVRRLYFCSPNSNAFDNAPLITRQLLLVMFGNGDVDNVLPSFDEAGDNYSTHDVARAVALKLVEFLPNVNELSIDGYSNDLDLSGFFSELCRQYCDQLQHVVDTIPDKGLFLAEAPKLKRMMLHTIPLGEGESFNKVVPPSLRSLEIVFHDLYHWDQIVDCNWSTMENITRLRIYTQGTKAWANYPSRSGPVYNQPRMLFPNLEKLVINAVPLSQENCRDLMQSPVKTLEYAGFISVACMLFQQRGSDSVLANVILFVNYDNIGFDSVQAANYIFAKTSNINKVSLNLHIPEDIIPPWSEINWPHLTHVCFDVSSGFDNLIKLIPAMPKVVFMKISYKMGKNGSTKKLKNELTKLKQGMNGPFASNIQQLTIKLTDHIPEPWLVRSFTILKEYLPLVDYIYVTSQGYCVAI